ncbi:LuxR C-terminal-related transcriptional regulator [Nocardiopsis aegyptia]|uniref:LuxR C-terminal-related transcriptional regulator n=1 Tax=Nocardiopsis aegyptia TaxID=220378 RepID=UPI00366DB3EE
MISEQDRPPLDGRTWEQAYTELERAERNGPLAARDYELLATAAYMTGADDKVVQALESAHRSHLARHDPLLAVRCAFWAGLHLALRGEDGPATGWLRRAARILEREGRDCVEHGYLRLPAVLEHDARGEHEAAFDAARHTAEIAERFGDADLFALAVHEQGRALIKLGRLREGLGLLDEAMVAVTADRLSPVVTGLLYCSVIDSCQEVFESRRAQEWTAALARWCDLQPGMVSFTGQCLLHRAELKCASGAWSESLDEAALALDRFRRVGRPEAAAQVHYLIGELHRLRGRFAAAERAYQEAAGLGRVPQPGLALLRLAQGRVAAAAEALRRELEETGALGDRARLLPAFVEAGLAAGDVEAAARASEELEALARTYPGGVLAAMSATAGGEVEAASGRHGSALGRLRRALRDWRRIDAPYEAARVRVLMARSHHALRDDDAAEWELSAARPVFSRLGAVPDTARVDSLVRNLRGEAAHGLSRRETQVLRLVATGSTNREIAAELVLSERTVERHVSNILAKLGVATRAAATAYAFEHDLR